MKHLTYAPGEGAESLQLVDGPRPEPGPGQILIEVHYAGVNRPDLMQRRGVYAPPPGASPILGLEVAGMVVALGGGVSRWRIGDAVCALVPGGGYAEYCVTSEHHALPIPAGLSLGQAAALPEVWFTVWANLIDLGHLSRGERVLIHGGASGVGLAALVLAQHLGAQAFVTVGSDQKAQFCRDYGAQGAINYRTEDFAVRILELTGGEGVDVVLDMVGAPYVERNLRVLRQDGRLVFVAFQQGNRCELDLWPVMAKRLRITGSTMRPRSVAEKAAIAAALVRNVWPALAAAPDKTHLHATFPWQQAAQAHQLMHSSRHIGKIVLAVRP